MKYVIGVKYFKSRSACTAYPGTIGEIHWTRSLFVNSYDLQVRCFQITIKYSQVANSRGGGG